VGSRLLAAALADRPICGTPTADLPVWSIKLDCRASAGGGDLAAWTDRLRPWAAPNFTCMTGNRHRKPPCGKEVVEQINRRPGCRAVLTRKRSLENYLHPAAIAATFGITVLIEDDTPVAERVAQSRPDWQAVWPMLSPRARRRLITRTKRRLNTEAVQHMTPALLATRDPAGEVCGWFRAIGALLDGPQR